MDRFKDFIIAYSGLSLGFHEFEFAIQEWFFEKFDYNEFNQCDFKVDVRLEKQERMLIFEFDVAGSCHVNCDRCADDLALTIASNNVLIVKFSSTMEEEDTEDIIYISDKDYQLDISQYIYEYVVLSLPYKKVHSNKGTSTCNKETLKFLETKEVHNDSIWDVLSTLKNEN